MLPLLPVSPLCKVTQALPSIIVQMAWFLVPSTPWPFSSKCALGCLQYLLSALTTAAWSSLLLISVSSLILHLILSTQIGHTHHQFSPIHFMHSTVSHFSVILCLGCYLCPANMTPNHLSQKIGPVLVCEGCRNKIPQTGWLNKNRFSQSSEDLKVQEQGVSTFGFFRGFFPWLADGLISPLYACIPCTSPYCLW